MAGTAKPILVPMKGEGWARKFQVLVRNQIELQKQVLELKMENVKLRETIHQEVERQLGERGKMIDAALNETIIHKKILLEKGLFSREELNAKYREHGLVP